MATSCSMDSDATNKNIAITNADYGELFDKESSFDVAKEIHGNIENTSETNNVLSNSVELAPGGDADGIENVSVDDRPRRNAKPSTKCIENTIQEEHVRHDREWSKVQRDITLLQNAPSSIEEITKAIAQVRAQYNVYEGTIHQCVHFLTNIGTRECLEARHKLDEVTANNKQLFLSNIEQGNQRKQELMLEIRSSFSGSRSHASSISSTALRARARAEAAAAQKKAELHKRRSLAETQSALAIQREELALAKRKLEEQARLETLRLEEDAAIAQAKVNAIDEELGLGVGDFHAPIDLPTEDTQSRVQQFLDNQPPPVNQVPSTKNESPILPPLPLNPTVEPFTPEGNTVTPDRSTTQACLEYMARREIMAKKVEKFDDNPENFYTWKVSFKNMLKDLRITPQEELSLLTEYTTNESKKLVQRLHNAYIQNPNKGVEQAWTKLGERFGSNVVLTKVHLDKLINFPKISYRDNKKLQEFGDFLLGLQCTRDDGQLTGLRILDEPIFMKPVVLKLPNDIQNRWQRYAFGYKRNRHVDYPPFSEFSTFVQDVALERNDPNLVIERQGSDDPPPPRTRYPRQTLKTDMTERKPCTEAAGCSKYDPDTCLLHGKRHPVATCRAFRAKPIEERKNLIRKHRLCFRCLASVSHFAKDCKLPIKCLECKSEKHLAALHVDIPPKPSDPAANHPPKPSDPAANHGGEESQEQPENNQTPQEHVTTKCTEICGDKPGGRSCSKICLASIFTKDNPKRKVKAYVVIDEQSNCSLAKPELFNLLGKNGTKYPYTLKTCAGITRTEGRHASDLIIESSDGAKQYSLPTVTECAAIPDNKDEIPTPEIAKSYPHLLPIAKYIPEVDEDVNVLLLVGRDAPPLHKVRESRNGRGDAPWAQRLDLGWVILGNACLDGVHQPRKLTTFMTNVLTTTQDSIFEPCRNKIRVHTRPYELGDNPGGETFIRKEVFDHGRFEDGLGANVFQRSNLDDKPGLSVEDRKFVDIMNTGIRKNESGNWIAPLPLRSEVTQLPDGRNEALKRLKSTRKTLDRKPEMKDHYFTFMKKILDSGHAERVPSKELHTPRPKWYLPHFGVYHPQKPDKIRVVFDSAAEVEGTSLNKLLLSGPDLTNGLLGVLIRFRRYPTAFMADIEQMFHSFLVEPDHRDFLRFLWYDGNNPDGEVVEYRMNVHLFGNTSSPAVATFCLRKTAQEEGSQFGLDARKFVEEDFYVDDGLKSLPKPDQSIDLLKRTQSMLATANLRLHKVASNDTTVTEAFPSSDRASDTRNLDLNEATKQIQRSLGVYWNLRSDTFTFKVAEESKPFTRRGVLSTINSLFDPLGIAAPVTVKGKMLLRRMTDHLKNHHPGEWDLPLPEDSRPAWMEWCQSLLALQEVQIPRCYNTIPFEKASRTELHVFCDASEQGIAAVCYQRSINPDGVVHVSFVFGKAKLTPVHATTIPRLELCAAVLAVEITQLILQENVFPPSPITYYSDSKVVLGYITNESRRFYTYVSNRVEIIRKRTAPKDWRHVPTHLNPADCATRSTKAINLTTSLWLTGPKFLADRKEPVAPEHDQTVENAREDPEVRPVVKTFTTEKRPAMILTQKSLPLPPPPGRFTPDDLHTAQWRQVQYLANVFWVRWKKEFLPLLQVRRKWVHDRPNLRVGDLVLLKNNETIRNDWPNALVTKTFPSNDGKVRTIEVTTARDGIKRSYTRPVTEVVLLLTADDLDKKH